MHSMRNNRFYIVCCSKMNTVCIKPVVMTRLQRKVLLGKKVPSLRGNEWLTKVSEVAVVCVF